MSDVSSSCEFRNTFYHIIPESDGGSHELYNDIHFERDKD